MIRFMLNPNLYAYLEEVSRKEGISVTHYLINLISKDADKE